MDEQKQQPTMVFNAPIFNYGGTMTGDVVNNYYGEAEKKPKTEAEVREALEKLMVAKDESGGMVFTKDYQWYGVMRVLTEFHDYPSTPKDFERVISNLNLSGVTHPCRYENFRKVPNDCSRLAKPNVWLWKDYRATASGKELEVINAAVTLLGLLGFNV